MNANYEPVRKLSAADSVEGFDCGQPALNQFLQSLPVVLLAVIGGIASAGGALFGGVAFALTFLIIPDIAPALTNLLVLGPAAAGISLGRNPNGAVNETARAVRAWRDERAARIYGTPEAEAADLDLLGLDGFTAVDRVALDQALGLEDEPLYGPVRPAITEQVVLAHG